MTQNDGLNQIEGVTNLIEIGRGGFGVVYRGLETSLKRDVAIKLLPAAIDQKAKDRFERERLAMGSLSGHPHIATIHRAGLTSSDQPYLVMEFLSGGSLRDRLTNSGPMHWTEVAEVGVKISGAVETAHRSGVLHRDIKPANIFVSGLNEPKLGDFGIARLQGGAETKSASITASMSHAPPEVISGNRPDAKADLYSLASTLYEMLAGQSAFVRDDEDTMVPMLARIASAEVPIPDVEPAGRPVLDVLIEAMAKDPAHRPASVMQFGERLRAAQAVAGVAQTAMLIEGSVPPPVETAQHTQTIPPHAPAAAPLPAPPIAAPVPQAAPAWNAGQPNAQQPGPPPPSPQPEPSKTPNLLLIGLAALFGLVLTGGAVFAVLRGADKNEVAAGEPFVPVKSSESTVPTTPPSASSPSTNPPTTAPLDNPGPDTTVPAGEGTGGGLGDLGDIIGGDDIGGGSGDSGDTPLPESGDRDSAGRLILVPVQDSTGIVSMDVPRAWAANVEDAKDYEPYAELETLGLGVHGFAAGGGFAEIGSGNSYEEKDLSKSGVSTFLVTGGVQAPPDTLETVQDELDIFKDNCLVSEPERVEDSPLGEVSVGTASNCDGGAIFPIVVVVSFIPADDPSLAGAVIFQLGEEYGDDFDSLDQMIATLDIDHDLVASL